MIDAVAATSIATATTMILGRGRRRRRGISGTFSRERRNVSVAASVCESGASVPPPRRWVAVRVASAGLARGTGSAGGVASPIVGGGAPGGIGAEGLAGRSGQLSGGLVALLRLLRHAAGNHVIEPGRKIGLKARGFGRIKAEMPGDLLVHAVTRKRLNAGQAFVQHTRQRIDVGRGRRRCRSQSAPGPCTRRCR